MKKYLSIAAAALSIGMTLGAGNAFAQAGDDSGANAVGQPPRYEPAPSANAPGYGGYYGYSGQDPFYGQQYAPVMPQGSVTGERYLESRSSRMETPRAYYR
jgi:hypothetical protein